MEWRKKQKDGKRDSRFQVETHSSAIHCASIYNPLEDEVPLFLFSTKNPCLASCFFFLHICFLFPLLHQDDERCLSLGRLEDM